MHLFKEENTKILKHNQVTINGYSVFHEKWNYDGLFGESLIFQVVDVLHFADDKLIQIIKQNSLYIDSINTDITISRKDEYVYVNFNFSY